MMTDGAAKEKMKDGCSWQEGRGEWEEIRWGEEKRGKERKAMNFIYLLLFFFNRKGRTAGYISVFYFWLKHFLFDHFVYFFKAKFQSSQYFLGETCWINNRDFNIDQNKRDYDFSHYRAALVMNHKTHICRETRATWTYMSLEHTGRWEFPAGYVSNVS